VIVRTIQSLHGFSRANPERRRTLVRDLSMLAAELAGDAEICAIAPQILAANASESRHPSPRGEGIEPEAQRADHAGGLKLRSIFRKCHFNATAPQDGGARGPKEL
jgi:hypothetical protein